jgi:hypothetical protein
MRLTHTYRHDFDSIADARRFLENREVQDHTVKAGEKNWGFEGDLVRIQNETFPISESFIQAFSHFMEPSIPTKFARQVPADLFGTIGNRLLRSAKIRGRKFQIRIERWRNPETQEQRRAVAQTITSDKYRRIDHERVLDEALAVTPQGKVTLTDTMLRVKSVVDSFTAHPWDAREGQALEDLHTIGFEIVNSETRNLALSVGPYVLRLICSNGMVAPVADLENGWKHKHLIDPDQALRQVREIIRDPERWRHAAEVHTQRAERLATIKLAEYVLSSDQYLVVDGMEPTVEEVKYDLAEILAVDQVSEMLRGLGREEEKDPVEVLTLYDLHNGITQMARRQDPDVQRALEVYAGNFLAGWTEA